MDKLPVIVAQGGISPAGRSSGFYGYRRLVYDRLGKTEQGATVGDIAQLRGIDQSTPTNDILAGTLVRKIGPAHFAPEQIVDHRSLELAAQSTLVVPNRQIPTALPDGWEIVSSNEYDSVVRLSKNTKMQRVTTRNSPVGAAGQLPDGFDPATLYQSRHHPRALAMTVYAASDALHSSGLDWQVITRQLSHDQIGVYAGSAMSQLDYNGFGGMMKARLQGKRVTSKQCPLGMAGMSADFINAYILGTLGNTGVRLGACASLLYNLQTAVNDIRSGRLRMAVIGNSEAPILPEVIDGYTTMGALATDDNLRKLDGLSTDAPPDYRRACRPFADNAGFTLSESAQFFILMDDELAIEFGAEILGAVPDVFVHADGHKKSISSPGVGNYLTIARAAALARTLAGEQGLRQRSYVQAHGTGTPQNRVTESHILDETAKVFGIENWPVTAVKSYLGHSIGTAAGDQLMAALGVWCHHIIPGIRTVSKIADDVHRDRLNFLLDHHQTEPSGIDVSLVNAKGFGGNNASTLLLSPALTLKMLTAKHGKSAISQWQNKLEQTAERQEDFESSRRSGEWSPSYTFGENITQYDHLDYTDRSISVRGQDASISLETKNPFWNF